MSLKFSWLRVTLGCNLALAILVWMGLGHFQRQSQAHEQRMPLREAVAAVHGSSPIFDPAQRKSVTLLTLGTAKGRVRSYDPGVIALDRQKNNLQGEGTARTDLTAMAKEMQQEGEDVFVLFCAPQLFAQEFAFAWQQLKTDSWELVAELPGTEAMYSYRLYRFQPSP